MTPERMRVKIAEHLGWRVVPGITQGGWLVQHNAQTVASFWFGSKEATLETAAGYLPDYPNDLNACHEMEKSLTRLQQSDYAELLADNFSEEFCDLAGTAEHIFACAHLTAPQRSEAFCRTVGIWEDEPKGEA